MFESDNIKQNKKFWDLNEDERTYNKPFIEQIMHELTYNTLGIIIGCIEKRIYSV
jgi:hypothetical protein